MFLCYKSQIIGLRTTTATNQRKFATTPNRVYSAARVSISVCRKEETKRYFVQIKGDDCRMTLHKARETTLSILKPAENLVSVFPTVGHSEAMMAGRVLEAGLLPVVTFSLTLSPFLLTPVCASGTCHDLVLPSVGLILL